MICDFKRLLPYRHKIRTILFGLFILAGTSLADTYYVRTVGNNSNSGTTPSQAWATVVYAVDQLGDGDRVYVGAGTYTGQIEIDNGTAGNIELYGDTDGSHTGDAGDVILRAPGDKAFYINQADGIRIESFLIRDARYGVFVNRTPGVEIVRCRMTNINSEGIYFSNLGSETGAAMNGNEVDHCGGHGIYANKLGSAAAIRDNHVHDNRRTGIYIENRGQQVAVIAANEVRDNSSHGIYLKKIGVTRIDSNRVQNNRNMGIYISNDDANVTSISDNIVLNNSNIGIYTDRIGQCNGVERNRVGGNRGHGIYIGDNRSHNVSSFRGNRVFNNRGQGIQVKKIGECNGFIDDSVAANTGWGIYVDDNGRESIQRFEDLVITGNSRGLYMKNIGASNGMRNCRVVDNTGDWGVLLNGNNGDGFTRIDGCMITGNRQGVYLKRPGAMTSISNNTITGNSHGMGIYIDDNQYLGLDHLDGNTITGNGSSSFYAKYLGPVTSITGNTLQCSSGYGITVYDNNYHPVDLISGNQMTGMQHAIYLKKVGGSIIRDNTISSTSAWAIYFDDGNRQGLEIDGNTLNQVQQGIYIRHSGHLDFTDNVITGGGNWSVQLSDMERDSLVFTGNTFRNRQKGVYIRNAGATTFAHNTFQTISHDWVLYFEGYHRGGSFHHNQVTGAQQGFYIKHAGELLFRANQLTGIQNNWIVFLDSQDHGGAQIDSNRVQGSHNASGYYLNGVGEGEFRANTIEDCTGSWGFYLNNSDRSFDLIDNTLSNCRGGIQANRAGEMVISGNTISDMTHEWALLLNDQHYRNLTISDNSFTNIHRGIYINKYGTLEFTENRIRNVEQNWAFQILNGNRTGADISANVLDNANYGFYIHRPGPLTLTCNQITNLQRYAVYLYDQGSYETDIRNNTFHDDNSYILYIGRARSGHIRNNIFSEGSGTAILATSQFRLEIGYNDFHQMSHNWNSQAGSMVTTGNLFVDPEFVDPDGDDYGLSPTSPCIDTGDPDSPADPDGSRADMGSHQCIGDEEEPPGDTLPAPVADYHFDSCYWTGSDGEVADSSGNSLHGRSYGDAETATGLLCRSASFGGTGDRLEIPNSSSLQLAEDLTIMLWVYPDLLAGRQGLVYKSYNHEFELIMEWNGTISFYHGDGSWEEIREPAGDRVVAGQWNHVAITRDMDERLIRFYIDGVFVGQDDFADTPAVSNSPVVLGHRTGTSYSFDGRMDELLFFDRTLTDEQIAEIYTRQQAGNGYDGSIRTCNDECDLPEPLVDLWLENCEWNGSIAEAADSSGQGNHGSSAGNVQSHDGQLCRGAHFGNAGDMIEINPGSGFDSGLTDLTVNAWVYLTEWGGSRAVIASQGDTGFGEMSWALFVKPGGQVRFSVWNENSNTQSLNTGGTHLALNQWYMVTGWFDGSEMKILIDGSEVADCSSGNVTELAVTSGPLTVGGSVLWNGDHTLFGVADEVSVVAEALTEYQINMLRFQYMNGEHYGGVASSCDLCEMPDPELEYRFDECEVSGSVTDDSGNSHTGTITGDVSVDEDGALCNAITFDGSGDYVNTGLDASWDENNEVSWSFWIRPADTGGGVRGIMGKVYPQWEWAFWQRNREVRLVYWNRSGGHTNGMDVSWGNVLTADHWTHLAYTWDGQISRLYANGALVSQRTAVRPEINQDRANSVMLGGHIYVWGDRYFTGALDEVLYFEKCLSPGQVADIYHYQVSGLNWDESARDCPECGSDGTLMRWYRMDDNGTLIADSSGHGDDAVPVAITRTSEGFVGTAAGFAGAAARIGIQQDLSQTFSLEAWIQPVEADLTGQVPLITESWGQEGENSLWLGLDDGQPKLIMSTTGQSGSLSTISWGDPIAAGFWSHLAVTSDSATKRLFNNGVGSPSLNYMMHTGRDSTVLGWNSVQSDSRYRGLMDEVRFWNTPLDSFDIYLMADYRFEETDGSVADSSHYYNHGTAAGVLQGVNGTEGCGIGFAGNGQVRLESDAAFAPGTHSYSIRFDITVPAEDSWPDRSVILSNVTGTPGLQQGYEAWIDSAAHVGFTVYDAAESASVRSTESIGGAGWQQITLVRDRSLASPRLKIYVGNLCSESVADPSAALLASQQITLGSDAYGNDALTASLDNLKFYRSALTPDYGRVVGSFGFEFSPHAILESDQAEPVEGSPVVITVTPHNENDQPLGAWAGTVAASARDVVTGQAVHMDWDLDNDGTWDETEIAAVTMQFSGEHQLRLTTNYSRNPVVLTFSTLQPCYGTAQTETPRLYWKSPVNAYMIYDEGGVCGSELALGEAGRTRTLTIAAIQGDCSHLVTSYVDTAFLSLSYLDPAVPANPVTFSEGDPLLVTWNDGVEDGLTQVNITYPEAGLIQLSLVSQDIGGLGTTRDVRYVPSEIDVDLLSPSTVQKAGRNFSLRLTARNTTGSVLHNYDESVRLQAGYVVPDTQDVCVQADIEPAMVRNIAQGQATVGAAYREAGVINIVARDSLCAARSLSLGSGTLSDVTFVPDHLKCEIQYGCKPFFYTDEPFTTTITALGVSDVLADTFTTRNYRGDIFVTPADHSGLDLTEELTFTQHDAGELNQTVTGRNQDGAYTLAATPVIYGSIVGSRSVPVQIWHPMLVVDSTFSDEDIQYEPDLAFLRIALIADSSLLSADSCSQIRVLDVMDDDGSVLLSPADFPVTGGRLALPINNTDTALREGTGFIEAEHEAVWIVIGDLSGFIQPARLRVTLNPETAELPDSLQRTPILDWKRRR